MTSPTSATASPTGLAAVGKILIRLRAMLALVLIIIVFSILSPNYLTVSNVLIMSSHVAIFALLGLGMLLVILTGGIDLSVGSTLGFCAVIGGFLLQGIHVFGVTLYPSVPVVVLISCLCGALIGLINGVLVAKFNVAPFVATLGMLYVIRGAALLMTGGLTVNDLRGDPATGNTGFSWLGFNRLLGVPIGVLIMIVIAIVLGLLLSRTTFGRWLYAEGGNERASELAGVPVASVKIWVYVISGLCAALAGLVLASTLTSASPTAGNTYELTAIATVVIGGASLMGGIGTVRGTLLGAFVIGFLSDGLVIVGVSSYWQMVFVGAVIVVAVLLNSMQYRRKGGRRRGRKQAAAAPDTAETDTARTPDTPDRANAPDVDADRESAEDRPTP